MKLSSQWDPLVLFHTRRHTSHRTKLVCYLVPTPAWLCPTLRLRKTIEEEASFHPEAKNPNLLDCKFTEGSFNFFERVSSTQSFRNFVRPCPLLSLLPSHDHLHLRLDPPFFRAASRATQLGSCLQEKMNHG